MTREQFESLTPRQRGYVAYMLGAREDFPGVPDEKNPYPARSKQAAQWDAGQQAAAIEAQEGDD